MKTNGKILFVIYKYQQYINFIDTGALRGIIDQVFFLVPPEMEKFDYGIPKERVISYSYPIRKNILHRHIFNINTWQNRMTNKIYLARSWHFTPRQTKIYSLISLFRIEWLVKALFFKRAYDPSLFELVNRINPEIIIIPSHAFDGLTFELIRIAKKINIPSFMLTENWDTLANKTIFTIKPEYLGVWSRQHIEHAIKYRGIDRSRIFIMGAPRFVYYLDSKTPRQPSPYPFRYALYVGITEPFDELSILHRIDELIEKNKIDLKIVYRPNVTQHTRECADTFFEYDFKHVVLDTPARLFYKRTPTWDISKDIMNPIYYPDSSYFPKLLSNMEFMIGPPTTMLLECALFNKTMYMFAFDDGMHRFGPKFTVENGVHIWDVPRLKNMRLIYNVEDIEKIFLPNDPLRQKDIPLDLDIDYFVAKKETANYSDNLKKTINNILSKWRETKNKKIV